MADTGTERAGEETAWAEGEEAMTAVAPEGGLFATLDPVSFGNSLRAVARQRREAVAQQRREAALRGDRKCGKSNEPESASARVLLRS